MATCLVLNHPDASQFIQLQLINDTPDPVALQKQQMQHDGSDESAMTSFILHATSNLVLCLCHHVDLCDDEHTT